MPSLRSRILALILAGAGTFAWWAQQEPDAPPSVSEKRERQPDYTVDNLTITLMGETGVPARRLTSRETRHYPDTATNELEEPKLTIFRDDGPPWIIHSSAGWVSEDGDEILLQGPVFIDREAGGGTRGIHVKTWELYVKPREEYAQTDRPVHATSDADWLNSSNGARIWFGSDLRVKLLGNVRVQTSIP